MTTHLFNDDMLAMIVEPNRHFRCETKLPEKDGDKKRETLSIIETFSL